MTRGAGDAAQEPPTLPRGPQVLRGCARLTVLRGYPWVLRGCARLTVLRGEPQVLRGSAQLTVLTGTPWVLRLCLAVGSASAESLWGGVCGSEIRLTCMTSWCSP